MNKYMEVAREQADLALTKKDGGPFGAVVVKDGNIVGVGHNMVIKKHDPTAHAEMMAIRDACKHLKTHDLSGCDIYSTSEPCPMCFSAILWSNIKKVYYGCTQSDTDVIGFRDKVFYRMTDEERKKILIPCDRNECLDIHKKYQTMKKKIIY